MKYPRFNFWDIVVYNAVDFEVWVVCKIRETNGSYNYDVYCRMSNSIVNIEEKKLHDYIHHKYLSDDDKEFYNFKV